MARIRKRPLTDYPVRRRGSSICPPKCVGCGLTIKKGEFYHSKHGDELHVECAHLV